MANACTVCWIPCELPSKLPVDPVGIPDKLSVDIPLSEECLDDHAQNPCNELDDQSDDKVDEVP
jgi:hypothetical protein